ncbi:hypothetical protein [Fluviicola sp.]|uniref:hypothetical protein n=1 Tax=Fluviicola sp. TaxID=1917219 RepID=UPI0031DE8494
MKIPGFKYIYADTNVVSNILKENGILKDFLRHFPLKDYNLLCFSTYTLYEISKSETLMADFRKVFAVYPCAIMFSYFPLGVREIDVISGKEPYVDPVLLTPQAISVDGKKMHPDSLNKILQDPSILAAFDFIEHKSEELFHEYSNLLDKEEFAQFRDAKMSRNQFVNTFKRYELKYRFFGGQWKEPNKNNVLKMKTLEVLGQGLYYKFYSDLKRKTSISDVLDILIMTTAPYCDAFISESNSIDIYRKIINMNQCAISTNYMTISDLLK